MEGEKDRVRYLMCDDVVGIAGLTLPCLSFVSLIRGLLFPHLYGFFFLPFVTPYHRSSHVLLPTEPGL